MNHTSMRAAEKLLNCLSELMTVKIIEDHYRRLRSCVRAHGGDISSSNVQGDEVPGFRSIVSGRVLREANA